ncbi:MAG: hypothetical protein QF503_09880, partial [Rhodospirillales bacterium]|nr:hypothetical protein [Rhodospirillales bacterium]
IDAVMVNSSLLLALGDVGHFIKMRFHLCRHKFFPRNLFHLKAKKNSAGNIGGLMLSAPLHH